MSDLLEKSFNEVCLFIFMGFTITTFAFLCNYLQFPKNLLSEVERNGKLKLPTSNNALISILNFFYEIDMISYTILTFIVYSQFAVVVCILFKYLLLSEHNAKKIIFIISAAYVIIILFLMTLSVIRKYMKKENWTNCSLWICITIEFIYLIFFCLGIHYTMCSNPSGKLFFLFIVSFLIILFVWYLIPIAHRKPVRNLLAIWQ